MRDPLRCSVSPEESAEAGTVDDDAGASERLGRWRLPEGSKEALLDLLLSCVAWFLFSAISSSPRCNVIWGILLALLAVSMLLWRIYLVRLSHSTFSGNLPYTCGYAVVGGKELFIVSTLHISPRSQKDVVSTIAAVAPDAVMIELDEERLEEMRLPAQPTWQVLTRTIGEADRRVPSQRAFWNGAREGETLSGHVVFDSANAYGLGAYSNVADAMVLLEHGGPQGAFAPLALKAQLASRSGARAVIIKGTDPQRLPGMRLGVESLCTDVRIALKLKTSRLPTIPAVMVPGDVFDELQTASRDGVVRVSFQVLADSFPRRGIFKRLCQESCFAISGIWVLYTVIECFSVDAGDEFMVAEQEAVRREIPCLCIDLDTDQLCARLGAVAAPWPRNVLRVVCSWLALPRCAVGVCFPQPKNVDVLGTSILHFMSFRCKIWLGFFISSLCAGILAGAVLYSFGRGAEGAAEGAGVVKPKDRQAVLGNILLAFELYLLPCVYEALVASRDEAMYQRMVSQVQTRPGCRRVVTVVGAAHANGILKKVRSRGL